MYAKIRISFVTFRLKLLFLRLKHAIKCEYEKEALKLHEKEVIFAAQVYGLSFGALVLKVCLSQFLVSTSNLF